jgi:hypothetical protein
VERITAVPLIASVIGVYVFDGALKYNGFSPAIVYGVFDAAAPWLVVGAVLAALDASNEDWWKLGAAVAVRRSRLTAASRTHGWTYTPWS